MPFGDIGFTGYWDASANLVLGTSSEKLLEHKQGSVKLYKVAVAGNTPLNGVTSWAKDDFAYYNGYEWSRIAGTSGAFSGNISVVIDGGRV